MLEIRSKEEFLRAIKANDVVMVSYVDDSSRDNELYNRIVKELVKHLDPRILVLKIDRDKSPELGVDVSETPCIRIYYKGRVVFEQMGFFGKLDLDIYVLRRSIRSVFNSINIAYKV